VAVAQDGDLLVGVVDQDRWKFNVGPAGLMVVTVPWVRRAAW
jgi:hypothetical protein